MAEGTTARQAVLAALWQGRDPFEGLSPDPARDDLQGWGSESPALAAALSVLRPRFIVEVGVWKGRSSIHMASIVKKLGLDAAIIAVDTWLGSAEHWVNATWRPALGLQDGYPTLYRTFVSNVLRAGMADVIVPLPLDFANAAEVLRMRGISPEILHIDAAHDFEGVAADLRIWWPRLAPGGAMIGDDYFPAGAPWPGVKAAFDGFIAEHGLRSRVQTPKITVFKPAPDPLATLPCSLADALRAGRPRSLALGSGLPTGLEAKIGRACADYDPALRIFGGEAARDHATPSDRAGADPDALRAAGVRADLAVLVEWPATLASRAGLVAWLRLLARSGVLLLMKPPVVDGDALPRLREWAAAGGFPLLEGPGGWAIARNVEALGPLLLRPGWKRVRASVLTRPVRVPVAPVPPDTGLEVAMARVNTKEWFAVVPGRGVLPAPSLQHKRRFPDAPQQIEIAYRRPALRLPDDKPVLLLGGARNYYHHLIDFCLRLFGSPGLDSADLRFLTCADSTPFHHPMREFFGLTGERVAFAPPDGGPVLCERLVIPATPVILAGEVLQPAAVAGLRRFAAARTVSGGVGEHLFISRSLAARGRLADEAPLAEALQARGFAILHLERMDFAAQVAAFLGARTIVGLHGAGLANMVFSPPGAVVVEIMDGAPPHPPFFERLAAGCGNHFLRVPAQGPLNGASLTVDTRAVLAAVDRALAMSTPAPNVHPA